jgi:hypothetical protein
MRAIFQTTCGVANDNANNIRAMVRYNASSTAEPNTTSSSTASAESCGDEAYNSLVSHLAINPDRPISLSNISTLGVTGNYTTVLRWGLKSSAFYVNWSDPTNLPIAANQASSLPADYNAYRLPQKNQWVYWVINEQSGLPPSHPMHLHGHDFRVLAQGNGNESYSPSSVKLNFDNPPRRNTATLAAGGYLVIAFRTDNSGSWLLHCHVAWHTSEGFSVQFIEREVEIVNVIGGAEEEKLRDTCSSWDRYTSNTDVYP